MKINAIIGKRFGVWKDVRVELPSIGLVAVTGLNGEGKSSIVEAISHACWNDSLRGPDRAWNDGVISMAGLELDELTVTRTRKKKGTPKLEFVHRGQPDQSATNTKAQEALDAIIGSFNVWKRTNVFSSADAAHFSLATDKTRKLLFEEMLGLTTFDAGLRQCRKDVLAKSDTLGRLRREASEVATRIQGYEARLRDAEQYVDQHGEDVDLEAMREELRKLRALFNVADEDVKALTETIRETGKEGHAAMARAEQARKKYDLLAGGQCPTCEQTIGQELQSALAADVESKLVEGRRLLAEADQARADLMAELDDATETRDHLLKKISDLSARGLQAKKDAERRAARREEVTATMQTVQLDLQADQERAQKLNEDITAVAKEVATLRAVEQVLGLKGPRAAILSGALAGVEAVANARLTQIGATGYQLRLRSYKETADGKGTTDAITLEMRTPKKPAWHRYSAASSGQRRRADVAIILGFAEVAGGQGTLFFDEVFDALDAEDGKPKVVGLLRELAAERCVVVITHSVELLALLQPDVHLRAENGTLAPVPT